MKILCLFLLFITSFTAFANPPDTLYYNGKWHLCEPYKALFYRVAAVERKDILFDGPVKDYIKGSNRLLMEGNYEMGKKDGLFTFYYLNGQPLSHGQFVNDKKTGQWQRFHHNGKLQLVTEYTSDHQQLLQALWDSTGNQLVADGNGLWSEVSRNTDNNRIIMVTGIVENGKRHGNWQVMYTNGQLLLEEHYKAGIFSYGDKWEKGIKIPYFQSRLLSDDLAQLSNPEYFAYDQDLMDKNYYGEGLYYFLHAFLGKPYAENQGKNYVNFNESSIKCNKNAFEAASFPGGPLALYRYINQMKEKTSSPDDINGMVIVNLRITRYGWVKDYYLSRGINITQNKKAIDKLKKTKWIPASCDFHSVSSYKRIAIFY